MEKIMTIPEIRDEMHRLAYVLSVRNQDDAVERLRYLAEQTRRRTAVSWAKPKVPHVALQVIRDFVAAHPGMAHFDVSKHLDIPMDRISKAVAGQRKGLGKLLPALTP